MPKPLRYADVYAGLQDGTVEERDHGGLYAFTPRMGRTTALVQCPFCRATVEVFTWSLAGGGKRCACGALFGRTTSYARVTRSSDLSFQCPACNWSTRNREAEQHICPESSDRS